MDSHPKQTGCQIPTVQVQAELEVEAELVAAVVVVPIAIVSRQEPTLGKGCSGG